MKESVRFFIAALFLTFSGLNCMSQTFENDNIEFSATVLSDLIITKDVDATFGNISGTTAGEVFLDPQGNENSYVGATATAGKLTIQGEGNQSIRVGWDVSITLDDGGENDMTLTLAVSGSGSDSQSSSTDLTGGGGNATVNLVVGEFFLWVGGSLGTLTNQPSGTYSGIAEFTVEYN